MATIKSYTDLEQSKKLAEILPLESADMFYRNNGVDAKLMWEHNAHKVKYPCWSLAALLNIIPYAIHKSDNEFYKLGIDKGYNDYAIWYSNNGLTINGLDVTSDNFVDACVEMILKLHELNLL